MTTISPQIATLTAPPCPVAWCEDSGHHQWDTLDPGQASRFHVRHTHGLTSQHEIGAQVDETPGAALERYVILFDSRAAGEQELRSAAAVDEVIHALADASFLAFGTAGPPPGNLSTLTAREAREAAGRLLRFAAQLDRRADS